MTRKVQNSVATVGTVSQAALGDLLGRGVARVVRVALQQQRVAEVSPRIVEESGGLAASCRIGPDAVCRAS